MRRHVLSVCRRVRHALWTGLELWGWLGYPAGPVPPDVQALFRPQTRRGNGS